MSKAMKMTMAAAVLALALAVAIVPASQSDAEGGFEITSLEYDFAEGGILVTLNQDVTVPMFEAKLTTGTETVLESSIDSKVVEDKQFVIGLTEALADGVYTVTVTLTSTMYDSAEFTVGEPVVNYTLNIVNQDGEAMMEPQQFPAGAPVTFSIETGVGVEVDSLAFTPAVEYTYDYETNTGSFVMPASDVTITATLKPVVPVTEEYDVYFTLGDSMAVTVDGKEYTESFAIENVAAGSDVVFGIDYTGSQPISVKDIDLIIDGKKTAADLDKDYTVTVNDDVYVSVGLIDYRDTEVTGEYSSKNIFDYSQIVTVKDYWTLTNGAYVEVFGKLVVPTGTTLAVDSDATLIIYGDAEIAGTVIVDDTTLFGGYLQFGGEYDGITYSGDATVAGTLDIEGTVVVYGDLTMEADSAAIIQEAGRLVTHEGSEMTVEKGATVTVYGQLLSEAITNEGVIVFDSEVPINLLDDTYSAITLKDAGVVDVRKMTVNGNYNVKYAGGTGALFVKIDDTNGVIVGLQTTAITPSGEDENAHVEAVLTGVRLAAVTVDKVAMIQISGNMEVSAAYVSESTEDQPEFSVSGGLGVVGNAIVDDSLVIGENTSVYAAGKFLVTGSIDATDGKFSNIGEVYVTGEGIIKTSARIDSETGVNATRYADGSTYNYVDIDAAIAQATDKSVLFVLGTQTVKAEDSAMPAGSKLDLAGAVQLIIGDEQGDTLTIAEGATITGIPSIEGDKINVVGTLLIENQLNVPSNVKNVIAADVVIYETDADGKLVRDGWVKYTNVYTALEEAEAGDTVNLMRDIVVDGEDLVIPEEVTLDTNAYDVTVKAPWKIIDNGIFDVDSKSTVTVGAKTDKKAAAEVIVNGVAKSDAPFAFVTDAGDAYLSAGAYYSITTKKTVWYIEPVANAVDDILTYDAVSEYSGMTVPGFYIRSNNGIEIGDITVAGDDESYAGIVVQTPLTSGTITLDQAAIFIEPENEFDIAVTDGVGTVDVNGTSMLTGILFGNMVVDDVDALFISGAMEGDIVASGHVEILDLIASTMTVDGEVVIFDDDEAGALIENVVVNGTLAVGEDAALVVGEVLNVLGTVDAQGTVYADIMLVGVDKNGKSTIAATPVVTGDFDVIDYALFNPNVVIPESVSKDADLDSTVFYGENDVKVVTAYASDFTTGINKNIKIVVENAYLSGWVDEDGNNVDDVAYGVCDAVYADIDYDIYHLTIVADYGVQNIAVDGIILSHGNIADNTYYKTLRAGTHEITVTLASGYTGTAKLYLIQDGKPVEQAGGKVTTTGTPETAAGFQYHLQVAGAEANTGDITIHVDPSDPTVVIQKESNDWTVSTILMLVLVILIALMAVILFLRLNRS